MRCLFNTKKKDMYVRHLVLQLHHLLAQLIHLVLKLRYLVTAVTPLHLHSTARSYATHTLPLHAVNLLLTCSYPTLTPPLRVLTPLLHCSYATAPA